MVRTLSHHQTGRPQVNKQRNRQFEVMVRHLYGFATPGFGTPSSQREWTRDDLGREVHAAQEVLEARVGAQTIIAGIDLNHGHTGGVLLISLL